MKDEKLNPFLSVVVVSRNDNHGGDLTKRTQIFINSLFGQADKHEIPMELVFVEWNPPEDKPPVIEAFVWPQSKFCGLKIITVPLEEHKKISHSDMLPLFQMIGKNVGIRNSSGKYILVTNIDVILSDEICTFIKNNLKKEVIYRCDRWDIDKEIPITNNMNEILEYCKNHIIRIQKRGETVPVSKINNTSNPYFNNLLVIKSNKPLLWHEILFRLKCLLFDNINKSYARFIDLNNNNALTLGVILKGTINWLKLLWANFFHLKGAIIGGLSGFVLSFLFSKSFAFSSIGCFLLSTIGSTMASVCGSLLGLFFGSFVGSLFGVIIIRTRDIHLYFKCIRLHTNACGDFMLMDKDSWFKTRGYYEASMYSWHLDSLFMFLTDVLGIKCHILPLNCIIYHIEHGGGWTPETEKQLFDSLDRKNIPYFTWNDLLKINAELKRKKKKSVFYNTKDWGIYKSVITEK